MYGYTVPFEGYIGSLRGQFLSRGGRYSQEAAVIVHLFVFRWSFRYQENDFFKNTCCLNKSSSWHQKDQQQKKWGALCPLLSARGGPQKGLIGNSPLIGPQKGIDNEIN